MNKKSIIIEMDGDSWSARREDFINLQESIAGFGDNPLEALVDLFEHENKASVHTDFEGIAGLFPRINDL